MTHRAILWSKQKQNFDKDRARLAKNQEKIESESLFVEKKMRVNFYAVRQKLLDFYDALCYIASEVDDEPDDQALRKQETLRHGRS